MSDTLQAAEARLFTRTARVATRSGEITTRFAMSTGWRHDFALNVFVEPLSSSDLRIQLAVNETHHGFADAIKRARAVNYPRAVHIIEKMRHALCDYADVPPDVHAAVIGNMCTLALVEGMTRPGQSLLARPDFVAAFHPVVVEYELRTQQQHPDIHAFIGEQLLNGATS